MKSNPVNKYKEKRPNLVTLSLSDKELAAIDEYCRMTGAPSRSSVIREGAVRFVREYLLNEHSKLFSASYFEEEASAVPTSQERGRQNKPLDTAMMGSLFGDDELSDGKDGDE